MSDCALMTGDLDGNIWMDELSREWFGSPAATPVIPPEDWSAAFHCYDPVTRMPLSLLQLPGYRALQEGDCAYDVLVAPPGGQERILHARGRTLQDPDGTIIGALVVCRDITDEWHERVGADVESTISICPCSAWQVEAPVGTPVVWIEEAVREHMRECVVLAATRMTAMSATAAVLALFAALQFLANLLCDTGLDSLAA